MKDSQRLALLKEVGGTKIYEERRRDSLKLMAESEGRQQRIQEVVRGMCCVVNTETLAQNCLLNLPSRERSTQLIVNS